MAYFRCGGGGHSDAEYNNLMDQLIEETATGPIASFTDGANGVPAISIIAQIVATQSGTGDPSPTNVRPISGFSACNVVRTGYNLFNKDTGTLGKFVNSSGSVTNSPYGYMGNYIPVKGGTNIHARVFCNDEEGFYSFSVVKYDVNKNFISRSHVYPSDGVDHAFVTPDNCAYVVFQIAVPSSAGAITQQKVDDGQIVVSYQEITAYKPYVSFVTVNIPFGQTVYGGTLNVTTGVLTVTHVYTTIDKDINPFAVNWLPTSYGVGWFYQFNNWDLPPIGVTEIFDGLCDILKPVTYNQIYAHSEKGAIIAITNISTTKRVYVWQNDTTLIDNASIKAWLEDNPIHLTYPLETPIIIQLTPQEIKTLLGANNFYHDCNGNTDVTYRANGALYVQEHPITRGLMAARPTEQIQEQEEQQEEKEINKSEDNEK